MTSYTDDTYEQPIDTNYVNDDRYARPFQHDTFLTVKAAQPRRNPTAVSNEYSYIDGHSIAQRQPARNASKYGDVEGYVYFI